VCKKLGQFFLIKIIFSTNLYLDMNPIWFYKGRSEEGAPSLKLEKIWFFGVKSWFFTRNTPTIFAPPSARCNFFKCAPSNLKPWIRPWIALVVRGAKSFGVFRVKNHDFTPNKIIFFSNFRGEGHPRVPPLDPRCTTLCDKVCQWLATGSLHSPCIVT
jgi:hypothetical protein